MITFKDLGRHGRLGNQMFQYAALKSLSIHKKYTIKIPYCNITEVFDLKEEELGKEDLTMINSYYTQPYFGFDESFFSLKDGVNIKGYFQSEKYFFPIKSYIGEVFIFKQKPCSLKEKTVSIHVRRGDYVRKQMYHPLCSMNYYERAMSLFTDVKFLVFSDDIEWCKQNFKGNQFVFSEGNSEGEDIALMSMCDHNIIANSSFSWWGAYLNKNKSKKVIVPKNWFGPALGHGPIDLIPKEWIII